MTPSLRDLTLSKIREFHGQAALATWVSIENWAVTKPSIEIRYGGGAHDDAINIVHVPSGLTIMTAWGYQKTAKIELEFEYLKHKQPFVRLTERKLYADRLAAVRRIAERELNTRPQIEFALLADPDRLKAFLDASDWLVRRLDNSWARPQA